MRNGVKEGEGEMMGMKGGGGEDDDGCGQNQKAKFDFLCFWIFFGDPMLKYHPTWSKSL